MYKQPFYLSGPVSNNAFSYEKRPPASRELCVASLLKGDLSDLQEGSEHVFEDYSDNDLITARGMQNFVQTEWRGRPLYIFDNHNHAFYFWHLERNKGTLQNGAMLIHIDQHKDTREPQKWLSPEDSQIDGKVFTYTNTVLNVGNFIPPAQKTGCVSEVIQINAAPPEDLLTRVSKSAPIILDLDMDYFAPEMDYLDSSARIEFIRQIAAKAHLITVSTSPFFMDQRRAIEILKLIFIRR